MGHSSSPNILYVSVELSFFYIKCALKVYFYRMLNLAFVSFVVRKFLNIVSDGIPSSPSTARWWQRPPPVSLNPVCAEYPSERSVYINSS